MGKALECGVLGAAAFAVLIGTAGADDGVFEGLPMAADEEMAEMRGGYLMLGGDDLQLQLSFGIERAVTINGELVSRSTLNLPTLESIGDVNALADTLVQNGTGNFALPSPSTAIVQNSLDNQVIRTVTVINATVQNLAPLFREMNFNSLLNQQLLNSVR